MQPGGVSDKQRGCVCVGLGSVSACAGFHCVGVVAFSLCTGLKRQQRGAELPVCNTDIVLNREASEQQSHPCVLSLSFLTCSVHLFDGCIPFCGLNMILWNIVDLSFPRMSICNFC